MVLSPIILSLLLTSPKTEYYPMAGVVVDVNYDTDIVTIDSHSNLWEFKGTEDWCPGDIAACIMSDNGTRTIYDDIIVDVRYQKGKRYCQ